MFTIRETRIFRDWLEALKDKRAASRITIRVARAASGNLGYVKPVGEGVVEMRIPYGPGISGLFCSTRRRRDRIAVRWRQGHAATRYCRGKSAGEGMEGMSMPLEILPFDAARYLDSDEGIEEFMIAAFEEGDPAFIAKCLGIVARAQNMSKLARDVGMSRAALYKALSGEGNPEFATILKVMKALGLDLTPVLSKAADTENAA